MKWTAEKDWRLLADLLVVLVLFSYATSAAAQPPGGFMPVGNMATARIRHTATLLLNGKVLITGGSDFRQGQTVLASAELFDPDTGTFTPTGSMATSRYGHSATLLPDGRVLIAGGATSGGVNAPVVTTSSAELYDPSTGTFTPTGNLVEPQYSHTATLLNTGKVLIADGETNGCCVAVNPEIYDPIMGAFYKTGDYAYRSLDPIELIGVAATLLPDGKVMIATEPAAELYDPAMDTFSNTGTMATRAVFGIGYILGRTASLLTDGTVLLTGGTNEDGGYYAAAELYDPSAGTFSAISKMTGPRSQHTATLLRDGTVLIAGGWGMVRGVAASTEMYDPATGTFSASGDMIFPRFAHTATLLMDGTILMAGGYTSYPASLNSNSAELYVPSVPVHTRTVDGLRFDRANVVAGASFSVNLSGSNLTPQTFFDVRFTAPGTNDSAVALNWQRGIVLSHDVPTDTAAGNWTINGVRAHEVETDHTGSFLPVSATLTVSQ